MAAAHGALPPSHDGGIESQPHFRDGLELRDTKPTKLVTENARKATNEEHKMSLRQGVRLYPKAIAWSLLISTCICMEGYDVCLLSSFCTPVSVRGHVQLHFEYAL